MRGVILYRITTAPGVGQRRRKRLERKYPGLLGRARYSDGVRFTSPEEAHIFICQYGDGCVEAEDMDAVTVHAYRSNNRLAWD